MEIYFPSPLSLSVYLSVCVIEMEIERERMRTYELSRCFALISHFYSVSMAETLGLYQAQEIDGLNILYNLEAGK